MKTIIILDVDSTRQNKMNNHFTAMGYSVRILSFAEELNAVSEKPFMIILDEKMVSDEKSGLQLLKKVNKKMSSVPVVYTVNRIDRKLISDARKMGAYWVIEKNSAEFVNMRTTLDKLISNPPKVSWFTRLFARRQTNVLPALSV